MCCEADAIHCHTETCEWVIARALIPNQNPSLMETC